MKKVLFFLMLLLTVCCSAFAECNLDMNRWKHLGSTDNYGTYFDTASLDVNEANSSFEVWECKYYPGNYSNCNSPVCEEKNIHKSEHYHYDLVEYNYKHRTCVFKSSLKRSNNGSTIDSYDVPSYLQKKHKLPPDSNGEFIMMKIKNYIDNPNPSKPEKKEEEPLPSIVINNVKKDEVQKLFQQRFKKMVESPDSKSLNPAIYEDNERITLKINSDADKLEKDGAAIERLFNIFTIQQGRDTLVKGEVANQLRFPDGMVVGPVRTTEIDDEIFTSLIEVKKRFNGWYRFGFIKEKTSDGYEITYVDPGFPFAKKGILAGDVIISINGKQLKDYSVMNIKTEKIIDPFSPDALDFLIKRKGKTKRYTIKPMFIPPEEIQKDSKENI